MEKNNNRPIILLGIVAAVYLVLALAIPFPKDNAAYWISFLFGLLAVGAQAYVMKTAFDKGEPLRSKFYGYPIAKIGVTYLAVQVVVSFLFMTMGFFFAVPAWLALVVCVLIAGVFSVGFISADIMRDEVERKDKQLVKDVKTMRALQSKTAFIVSQCTDTGLKPMLRELSEKFRFSDPVSSDALAEIENDLTATVDELQAAVMENDIDSAKVLCAKVAATLEQRNTMCKLNKMNK